MYNGNYILVLHTHLPWVLHHGTWPHGSDWLCEAAAECYIPLLNVFNDLMEQGIYPKTNIDISPVLCEQLEHPDFKPLFESYCKAKIEAAQNDEKQFTDWGYDPHHFYLAKYWQEWYEARLNDFIHKYDSSIISGMKKLQDSGAIEIMTCGATHGYLPLLGSDKSVNLQIQAAVENYKKYFGRQPRGIWLPECAYRGSYNWRAFIPVAPFHIPHLRTGIEQFLANYGIEYFIVDEHLTRNANPLGVFLDTEKLKFISLDSPSYKKTPFSFDKSPMSMYNVSSSQQVQYGTAIAFTRHKDISMQVWSGSIGYPGEPDYLDFHKKHLGSRLRYWRVTDSKADMMYKTLYHPDWIWKKIDLQSNHFIHHLENTVNWFNRESRKFASLCTPFDTELFGHWWFEGPEFIKAVLKGLNNSPYLKTATASEQIYRLNPSEVMSIPEGSWGKNGTHEVWTNEATKWTWESIYNDENRFQKMFEIYKSKNQDEKLERILKQALRELMLLQSSDWQFLISTESATDYAEQRFSYHHSDFNKLCDLVEKYTQVNELNSNHKKYLEDTEKRNSPFPELKLEWWKEIY